MFVVYVSGAEYVGFRAACLLMVLFIYILLLDVFACFDCFDVGWVACVS